MALAVGAVPSNGVAICTNLQHIARVTQAVSLTSVRRIAPAEFRRWVIGGVSLALAGYSVITVVQIGAESSHPGIGATAALFCALGLALAIRGFETTGAVITVLTVWIELQLGFLRGHEFPAPGMMMLPVLLLGIGLLHGTRVALVFTVVSLITCFITTQLSPVLQSTGLTSHVVYWYTLFAIAMFAVWSLVAFSLLGFSRIFATMSSQERDLSDTLRFAPDGIVVLDGENRVLLSNPAAELLLGRAHSEMVGQYVEALLDQSAVDADEQPALSLRSTGESPIALQLRASDGGAANIEATSRRMTGDRRQLLLRDVTQRVRAEQQKHAIEQQLAHARRLEAVGRLAGGLSHDFNNILTAVGGSAELLRHEHDPIERDALIDDIVSARDRGTALTRQLLSFARREVTQPLVLDLAEHVEALTRLLQRVAGDRHHINFALVPGCRVRVDPGQLEQALVNLVSNARDAMPDGGQCTISCEQSVDDDGQARALLHVIDDGVGMTDDVVARAFEPFFTTKSRGHGTGLGLASVHGMAIQSLGTARIVTAPGRGTRVTIDLPYVNAHADALVTPETEHVASDGTYTILVAEDDELTRRVVERMLQRAGYHVAVAADGIAATRLVESGLVHFDLLLTDVMMPGCTGPAVAERVRALHPDIPVLFMTGYAEDSIGELGALPFDHGVIAKPFSVTALTQRVAELLRERSRTVAHSAS